MGKEQELRPCPFCSRRLIMKDPFLRKWVHPLETQDDVDCAGSAIEVSDNPVRIAAWNRRSSDEQAEVVGYVDRLSGPTRISATEQPELEMPVYASAPPAVAKSGVTSERLEAGAKALCLATGLDWDSIPETAEGDDKDTGPETRRYFRQWFKPALTAALAVRDEGIREGWQPISTAPKDGTEIQVFVRTDEGAEMQQIVHWDGAPTAKWPWQVNDGSAYHRDLFTHWRPLPTPPSRGEGV